MRRPWAVAAGLVAGGIAVPLATVAAAGDAGVRPGLFLGAVVAVTLAAAFGADRANRP